MKKLPINPKDYVEGLEPFPEETYRNMDLDRLAVYTMALLLENNIPLYFDYIVVALFRLFPEKSILSISVSLFRHGIVVITSC